MHTKGPWKMIQSGHTYRMYGAIRISGERRTIARVQKSDESEANARLIAAAPDLLEACKFVAARLTDGDCEYDDVANMVLNLRAAIQKAEPSQ